MAEREKRVVTVKIPTLPTGLPKRNRSCGFTLIELLAVLSILAFFFGLASIRIESPFSAGDLRYASRIIIGEITRLRGLAAYTHTEQFLGFDMDTNCLYFVKPQNIAGTQLDTPAVEIENRPYFSTSEVG